MMVTMRAASPSAITSKPVNTRFIGWRSSPPAREQGPVGDEGKPRAGTVGDGDPAGAALGEMERLLRRGGGVGRGEQRGHGGPAPREEQVRPPPAGRGEVEGDRGAA